MSTNSSEKKRWKGWKGRGFKLLDPVRMFFTIDRSYADRIREMAAADNRGEYDYIRNVLMQHVDEHHEETMERRAQLEALRGATTE